VGPLYSFTVEGKLPQRLLVAEVPAGAFEVRVEDRGKGCATTR
jgi:hypothetical protein